MSEVAVPLLTLLSPVRFHFFAMFDLRRTLRVAVLSSLRSSVLVSPKGRTSGAVQQRGAQNTGEAEERSEDIIDISNILRFHT